MRSNINNFGVIGDNRGRNLVDFLPRNNIIYSEKYHEVLSILSHNVAEAKIYLQERTECRNNFFPNNNFTSTFHDNSYLNTLLDNGLTEKDISRLNKIFNFDTRALENKNELPLFPHNNNENLDLNSSIDEGIRGNHNDFIPYPPGIPIQTEKGNEQPIECTCNCIGISYQLFEHIKTYPMKTDNIVVYMTFNGSNKWEYWQQTDIKLTQLQLNKGKKITPGNLYTDST